MRRSFIKIRQRIGDNLYKTFFTILIVLLLISTVCIGVLIPKMHKSIFLYSSDLKIVLEENDSAQTEVAPVKINTIKQQQDNKKIALTNQDNVFDRDSNTEKKPVISKSSENITAKTQPKTTEKQSAISIKPVSKPVTKSSTSNSKEKEQSEKPAQQTAEQQEQAQLVLWNKWRSDLQNRIMTDVKLPIVKQGTVFQFSFDVDKYGKITNITTWSSDPAYTPYAIQYIAPVIRSYQGRDFMNFPSGSNRVTTKVSGAWKISDKTTYSTPSDYKDIEKIRN